MLKKHKGIIFILVSFICCILYMASGICDGRFEAKADNYELKFIPLDEDLKDDNGLVYMLDDAAEPETATVVSYTGNSNIAADSLTIPESVMYNKTVYYVETVDFSVFANKEIEFLAVSDTVKNYDNIDSSNILITSLYIGGLGTSIDYKNLNMWSKLRNIYVSDSNTAYTSVEGILYDCNKEKLLAVPPAWSSDRLSVPDTVVTIGENAFKNSNIRIIEHMNALCIENSAFESSSIQSIDLKKVIEIGYRAFYDCEYINNIEFNNKVHIGEQAFYNCSSLKWLSLPGDVTIDNSAFCYCRNLQLVAIGEGTGIGKELDVPGNGEFFNCPNVKSIYLPDTLEVLNGAFCNVDQYNENIERVYVPHRKNFNIFRFCRPLINTGEYKHIDILYGDNYDDSDMKVRTEVVLEDEDGILVADVYEPIPKALDFNYYPGMKPIQFNDIYPIYGEGQVSVNKYMEQTAISGSNILGVMMQLSKSIPHRRSVKIYVEYEAEYPMRIWLCKSENEKLSDVQRLISGRPVVLRNNVTDWYENGDYITIKGKNSSFIVENIYIKKMYMQVLDEGDGQETVYPELKPEGGEVCSLPEQLYDMQATKHDNYKSYTDKGSFVSWDADSEDRYKGFMLRFAKPKNLNEYNYIAIDAAGSGTYNIKVRDYYRINQYGDEESMGSVKDVTLPAVISLSDIKKDDKDYSSVSGVVIQPYDSDAVDYMNIRAVAFYKNEEDIPEFNAIKPVITPNPTSSPKPTSRPTAEPTASPEPTPYVSPDMTPVPSPVEDINTIVMPTPAIPLPTAVNNPHVSQMPKTSKPSAATAKMICPVISVSKGKSSGGTRYILVRLRKYSGKYIHIYAGNKGKLNRIKLSNNNIKANKASFKLKYSKTDTTIRIKVRTYYKKNKKNIYSKYSVINRIKV